jgi:hypothetical protein
MTAQKSTKKRPYQYSGHYAVSKALESVKDQEKWLNDQGPLGEALKQLREDLIEKQGGKEAITPAELMAIEGLVFCHMLMMSAGRFIEEYRDERFQAGRSAATILYELRLLRRAFRLAKRTCPPLPSLTVKKVRKEFFEPEEVQAILHHLPSYLRPVMLAAFLWVGGRNLNSSPSPGNK